MALKLLLLLLLYIIIIILLLLYIIIIIYYYYFFGGGGCIKSNSTKDNILYVYRHIQCSGKECDQFCLNVLVILSLIKIDSSKNWKVFLNKGRLSFLGPDVNPLVPKSD